MKDRTLNAVHGVEPKDSRRMDAIGFAGSRRLIMMIVAIVVVLDQATKALVRETLPLHASVNIVPGLLDLTHVRNTGAAFGILNAADFPFKSAVMTIVAAVALLAIATYAVRSTSHGRTAQIGLALVLGGAIGNLIDRAMTGYVIDFVDVYWRSYHFWAFNAADSAITVGAVALVLDMLIFGRHVPETP